MSDETYILTKEAMRLCRVKSYDTFAKIKNDLGVRPVWRSGEGDVYRKSDFIFQKPSEEVRGFGNV